MPSYLEDGSKRGERGDCGLKAGEGQGRGDGIRVAERGDKGRGAGDKAREDAVMGNVVDVYLSVEGIVMFRGLCGIE